MKRAGQLLLALVLLASVGAPWLSPNPPELAFPDHLYAPPTRLRLPEAGAPGLHFYPSRLVSRLERTWEEDRSAPIRLQWFANGRLVSTGPAARKGPPYDADRGGPKGPPLLVMGADPYGRDVFARVLYGTRTSLALAIIATLAAVLLGATIGATAGYLGGTADDLISRMSDFVLVLPTTYVVLALRAVMPLVLPAGTVFMLLAAIFAIVGWPIVARGVRGIVASEREREYIAAARAIGGGHWRLVMRHLLPAARGHLQTQATLLLPAFILAEATLSYVGLGFPDTIPTWGTMLQEASNGALIGESPWMLAPAGAIFLVVLAVNLLVQGTGHTPVQLEP